VSPPTKRRGVNEILNCAGETLNTDSEVSRAFGEDGIGHPDQYFLLRPDAQIGFLLDFTHRLKREAVEQRRATLSDPWRLRDFVDRSAEDGVPGMRHIILHLLQPDAFERISTASTSKASSPPTPGSSQRRTTVR
jgi:5-methylcytosine-specific restriction enzyme B